MRIFLSVMFSVIILFSASMVSIYAGYENFIQTAQRNVLDTFTKDLGAVMGAGQYHNAKGLGLAGFDAGVRVPMKTLSDGNVIKTKDNTLISLPAIQVEKGLPMDIDLVARGVSAEGVSSFGVSLKYMFFKLASISFSGMVNWSSLKHANFETTNTGVNFCTSVGIPIITPFIAVGFDSTELTPTAAAIASNSTLAGMKGNASGMRADIGLNISPFPLLYLYGAYSIMYGDVGQTFGLGIRF